MKVLHLGHVPVPDGHPERVRMGPCHPGRWVLNHALAQKAAGMDVEVVSQAHKASRDFDCEIEGVTVHFLRTFHPYRHFTFYALDAWRMARFVRRMNPDVVHAHGTEAAYGHAAVRSGLPFCVTAQGLFFKILPTLPRSPTIHERFLLRGEEMVWKQVRYAIAKSEYGKMALKEKYPALDVSLIHNALDLSLENPVPGKVGSEIAFVGTPDLRKGAQFLPAIARRLADNDSFRFHLIGNSPEGCGSECERSTIAELRAILGSRFVLHGRMSADGVFSVLDKCRAIVVPSLEEMSGNQATEGIMRGCHAIVFDETGVAGIVKQSGNGTLVPFKDTEKFAEAVSTVLTHPPNREQIEAGRAGVSALMSPAIVAAKHKRLYNRILAEWSADSDGMSTPIETRTEIGIQ